MNQDIVYIVGDNFLSFAKLNHVYTFSEVVKLINNNEAHSLQKSFCIIGQGLNKAEKIQLELYSRQNKIGLILNAYKRNASQEITHKHKTENIMITDPLVVEPGKCYRSYLAIDDDCAEMNDHLTGQHIQGMVITEAARQMMLAVAEKYILKQEEKGNSYCILKTVASHFFQFAFPIDIKMEHEIFNLTVEKSHTYAAETCTNFIQNNIVIARINIDYEFRDKTTLGMIEAKMAERSARTSISLERENLYVETAA